MTVLGRIQCFQFPLVLLTIPDMSHNEHQACKNVPLIPESSLSEQVQEENWETIVNGGGCSSHSTRPFTFFT